MSWVKPDGDKVTVAAAAAVDPGMMTFFIVSGPIFCGFEHFAYINQGGKVGG